MSGPLATESPVSRVALTDRILDAAADLFATRGYFRTTVADVADRVGMTACALTERFRDTGTMLNAILGRRDGREAEFVGLFDQPGGIALLTALKAMVRGNADTPDVLRLDTLVAGECVLPDYPAREWAITRMRWLRSLFAGALRRDIDAGLIRPDIDPTAVAAQIAAVMCGLQVQWLIDPDEIDMADTFDDFIDGLLAQLAPTP